MTPRARLELHLLRHADAGDPEAWSGDDDVRPLSDKGIRQAERLGRHLARVRFEPDAIITSPRARARQTADLVAATLGADVSVDDRLAGSLDVAALAAILRDAGDLRRPVLVGHDPEFSDLVTSLTGARAIQMKKGALARLDLPGGLGSGDAVLRWLLPPDLLPRD
jgi:phosphohistidine phosphatase SixA